MKIIGELMWHFPSTLEVELVDNWSLKAPHKRILATQRINVKRMILQKPNLEKVKSTKQYQTDMKF